MMRNLVLFRQRKLYFENYGWWKLSMTFCFPQKNVNIFKKLFIFLHTPHGNIGFCLLKSIIPRTCLTLRLFFEQLD